MPIQSKSQKLDAQSQFPTPLEISAWERGAIKAVNIGEATIGSAQIGTASIHSANIADFSFNSGTGGTLTLGGTNNQSGLMVVKDSGGTNRVNIDNAGVTITDGKLTFVNPAGGTVVDGSGIVSTVSFPSDVVFSNSTNSTTGTVATDLPGSSLTSFVLPRNTKALINTLVNGNNPAFPASTDNSIKISVVDSVDGTLLTFPIFATWRLSAIQQDGSQNVTGWSCGLNDQMAQTSIIYNLSAGTHTLGLKYQVMSAGTAIVDNFEFSYIILGS